MIWKKVVINERYNKVLLSHVVKLKAVCMSKRICKGVGSGRNIERRMSLMLPRVCCSMRCPFIWFTRVTQFTLCEIKCMYAVWNLHQWILSQSSYRQWMIQKGQLPSQQTRHLESQPHPSPKILNSILGMSTNYFFICSEFYSPWR